MKSGDLEIQPQKITNLRCALPRAAWTDTDSTLFKPVSQAGNYSWRIVEYECDSHAGHVIWGTGSSEDILTIPLEREGWQAIHLLIAYADLDVRLTGEKEWQRVRAFPPKESVTVWREAGMWGRPLIWEPLRFADITGKNLEIRIPPLDGMPVKNIPLPMAALWGVKTTPLSKEHVELIRNAETRRTVFINDGFGIFFHEEDNKKPIVKKAFAPFLNSNWNTCCYGIGQRGYPNYPSKLVDYQKDRGWAFVREGDERYRDNVKALIDRGEDTLQTAVHLTHESKQKIWMYIRPQLWSMVLPWDHSFRSPFYAEHPECRCLEADGKPFSKMSIAFSEVRKHFADFIAEGLERGVDGICLALTRGYPLVRYEKPVLTRMQERFGVDARTLPETDERLQDVWAEFVNEWFIEIREQLTAAEPSPDGSSREIAVFTHTQDRCALFGCDLAAWVSQRLVNIIIAPNEGADTLAAFTELTQGSDIQLIVDIGGGTDKTIHSLRTAANALYDAGADGLAAWDTEEYLNGLQLQHPEIQQLWCEFYMQERCLDVQTLSGEYLNPYNPALGG